MEIVEPETEKNIDVESQTTKRSSGTKIHTEFRSDTLLRHKIVLQLAAARQNERELS